MIVVRGIFCLGPWGCVGVAASGALPLTAALTAPPGRCRGGCVGGFAPDRRSDRPTGAVSGWLSGASPLTAALTAPPGLCRGGCVGGFAP